jgi:hypothetical protein
MSSGREVGVAFISFGRRPFRELDRAAPSVLPDWSAVAKFGGDLCNGRRARRLLSSPDPTFEFEMLQQGKILIVEKKVRASQRESVFATPDAFVRRERWSRVHRWQTLDQDSINRRPSLRVSTR